MSIKIGINGLGRIGRMVIRAIFENKYKNIKIAHINNRSNTEVTASLLKYDSIHGQFKSKINFDKNNIFIEGNKIPFTQETDIKKIDWRKNNVDLVLECTGKFNSKDKLLFHLKNGAKKVLVSAPCKNSDKTIVYGVNENALVKNDKIISAASCTTNCLAPVVKILNDKFLIEKGFMTTIHAITSDQRILDNSHKDPRRARSASQSIVPTSTGASKAIGEIIPSLKGKLEGVAMRVPTPNVSLVELVFCTNKNLTIKEINNAFTVESKKSFKGILDVSEEKLVSVDFNHNSFSAVVDSNLTNVIGKKMGKVSVWYDNEWGFSCRMCDLVEYVHKKI
tara:strand:- start:980 stop:1987 length:1008 start_codon:yes stop_codon:yes gene_type:complete